ncbi:hypothetical protein H0H81_007534 [Sphagnurus paluster]|uniref:Uncharacterized protein n=1 Tax=Sphagnurus paluster TaxID=117069 RepID=A0A9P7FQQ9_9AGAR|nr:hypothetical protein H0H81_007534 [Sphagnurus paluster]
MVTALSITQVILELITERRVEHEHDHYAEVSQQPLLERPITTRPRSKSKPDDIFIHPAQSNLARADALASELGISGNTDRVHVNKYERQDPAWTSGEGQEAARALLGSSRKIADHFHVGNESDSD